jgi:nucleoid-associated protein YgaU
MPEDKKKNIFEKAVDAFSSRDEKQAKEEAEKAAEVARQAAAQAAKDKAVAEIQANQAKKEAEEARKKMEEMKKKQDEAESKAAVEARQKAYAEHLAAQKAAKPEVKVVAEHTVKAGETLSHVSLKYYGSAVREYWMYIYEFNKEVIGGNPSMVREGVTLKIPELTEEMKK